MCRREQQGKSRLYQLPLIVASIKCELKYLVAVHSNTRDHVRYPQLACDSRSSRLLHWLFSKADGAVRIDCCGVLLNEHMCEQMQILQAIDWTHAPSVFAILHIVT